MGDIKGISYAVLKLDAVLKPSFAQAIQQGIVPEGLALDSSHIGLDISDGHANTAQEPFIHVVARIPVPADVSADEFMRRWPGGRSGCSSRVQTNIKALSGIGPLTTNPTADIINKVRNTLASRAGLSRDDVQVKEHFSAQNTLRLKAELTAHGVSASQAKLSEWSDKLLPAARDLDDFYRLQHPTSIDNLANFAVVVGPPKVSNAVDSVELDLIVHGMDYQDMKLETKNSFLSDLANAVRDSVAWPASAALGIALPAPAHLTTVKDDIEVFVSGGPSTINVRARIPGPWTAVVLQDVLEKLEANKDSAVKATLLQHLQKSKFQYVSTWTPQAITVSMPGHIDDFAGDKVGPEDAL